MDWNILEERERRVSGALLLLLLPLLRRAVAFIKQLQLKSEDKTSPNAKTEQKYLLCTDLLMFGK